MRVWLYYKGKKKEFRVHRLVGKNFLLNYENKPEINHIDSDKTNNNISNLEWSTTSENITHSIRAGTHKINSEIKLTNSQVQEILKEKNTTHGALALKYNVSRSHINNILTGKKRKKAAIC
jgi:hypothetical protein